MGWMWEGGRKRVGGHGGENAGLTSLESVEVMRKVGREKKIFRGAAVVGRCSVGEGAGRQK